MSSETLAEERALIDQLEARREELPRRLGQPIRMSGIPFPGLPEAKGAVKGPG